MKPTNDDRFLRLYYSQLQWALQHLEGTEYKVFTYLISIIIRPNQRFIEFKNGKEIYEIYHDGKLLPVNVSHETIRKNCNIDIKTVRRVLKVLHETGVALTVSKKNFGHNNIYLMGMRNIWDREDMKRSEYLFVDTDYLQRGKVIPEDIRKQSVNEGNLRKSEDICFCERAEKYGFDRFVDLSVHAAHFKTISISGPKDSVDPDIDAIDWKPSKFDHRYGAGNAA